MMADGPEKNFLLATLFASGHQRLAELLEPVELTLGQVIYEHGESLTHAYFPTTAIVSLLYVMENGDTAEIAIVGNDGLVGVALLTGGESTAGRAIVQSAGAAYRIKREPLQEQFFEGGAVLRLLLRYMQALMTQTAQTAICNRHHSLDQQLCRWLLLTLDRLDGEYLVMTHSLISNMLGVRREGVTDSALKLQREGVIQYSRGKINVLDRPALEQRACECYEVVRQEYARLLPGSN